MRGAISSSTYATEIDVLEVYGTLLDGLGDRYEAGKYLFLSGTTDPKHADAIEVFLSRTRKLHANALMAQFPGALRRAGLGHLPESVRTYLESRGASITETRRRRPLDHEVPQDARLVIGCLVACLVMLVATSIIGLVTVVTLIGRLL